MRDRHSRTGLTKSEFDRKGGAGPHNWGSFTEEERAEYDGSMDARLETAMFDDSADADRAADAEDDATSNNKADDASSEDSGPVPAAPQRRMSQVSDQERADALRYREGGLKQNGVDLANIARTSHGIAQSPPASSMLSTSPLRQKSGFSAVSVCEPPQAASTAMASAGAGHEADGRASGSSRSSLVSGYQGKPPLAAMVLAMPLTSLTIKPHPNNGANTQA